jgi:hypothetical protein
VEDAAEPVSSAYVQVGDSSGIGDRVRDGTQWSRLVQGFLHSRNRTTDLDSRPQNVWLESPRRKGATLAVYALSVSEEWLEGC